MEARMGKRAVSMRPQTREALVVLGQLTRIARIEREWTAKELAARVGVSEQTILAIEKGAPGTAIGTVLNVADLLGMRFFPETSPVELARTRAAGADKLALLPSRVVKGKAEEVFDDF